MDFFVRPMTHSDIREVYNIRMQGGVMPNVLSLPSDTLEEAQNYFTGEDPQRAHFFVAEELSSQGFRVVGAASLVISPKLRQRHIASLGLMVHEDYHRRGIGRMLMNSVVDLAYNWLGLVRLELEVFCDNTPAIRLYEEMGFVCEGIKTCAQMRLGRYVNVAFMARINKNKINSQE